MAQSAHKRASRVMDAETEARLAAIINSDLEQLREKAEVQGVLAYGLKPVRRERLNERFLQNTLKSVGYANKKADEDEMWAKRRRQHSPAGQHYGSASPKYHSADKSSWSPTSERPGRSSTDGHRGPAVNQTEGNAADVDHLPPAKRRKGRGGRGLKGEDAGPYLPADMAFDSTHETVAEPRHGRAHGPARPAWLPRPASPLQAESPSLSCWNEQRRDTKEGDRTSPSPKHKHKHKKKSKHKHRDSSKSQTKNQERVEGR